MPKSGRDGRLRTKVKTAKGRKISSTRWLERQLNDPYVAQAQKDGYRSRAAYKLIEIDDKYKLLKPGQCVVDLGCAPGGWSPRGGGCQLRRHEQCQRGGRAEERVQGGAAAARVRQAPARLLARARTCLQRVPRAAARRARP